MQITRQVRTVFFKTFYNFYLLFDLPCPIIELGALNWKNFKLIFFLSVQICPKCGITTLRYASSGKPGRWKLLEGLGRQGKKNENPFLCFKMDYFWRVKSPKGAKSSRYLQPIPFQQIMSKWFLRSTLINTSAYDAGVKNWFQAAPLCA